MPWISPAPRSPVSNSLFRLRRTAAKHRLRRLFLEPLEDRRMLVANEVGFILYGFPPSEIDQYGSFPITRFSDDWDDTLTIQYTVSGSATKGSSIAADGVDHNLQSGSVVIDANQDQAGLTFDVKRDDIFDPGETIRVTITSVVSSDPSKEYYIHSFTEYVIENYEPEPEQLYPGCTTCSDPGTLSDRGPEKQANSPIGFGPQPPAMTPGTRGALGPSGVSAHPVRYADGTAIVVATDLMSESAGLPWGVTRQWTNAPGYAPANTIGSGMVVTEQPRLIDVDGAGTLAVIKNGHSLQFYDETGTNTYSPRGLVSESLTHDVGNKRFVLTDMHGATLTFHDFDSSFSLHQQGQLESYTDPSGANTVSLTYSTTTGDLEKVERSSTVGGITVIDRFVYSYIATGENWGLVESIEHEREESSTITTIRQALYDYYVDGEAHGNIGDLKTVQITDGTNVLDTTYYRYYKPGDSNGYARGLKYVFYPQSFARLVAAHGGTLSSITDANADDFADHYFEYDSLQRVTKEVAQGAGCSTCSGGLGSFLYDYDPSSNSLGHNSWAMKTTETLPDGNLNVVYTNGYGQVMLQQFVESPGTTSEKTWGTFFRYDDADGRLEFRADPSAVTGYDDTSPDLMEWNATNEDFDHLDDNNGLFTEFAYYPSTNATYGWAEGYLEQIAIHEGELGSWIVQSRHTYVSQEEAGTTIFLPSGSTSYVNENATGGLTTSFVYEFYTDTLQVKSMVATDSAGGETKTFYDTYGRPTWTKDAEGFIHYVEYDAFSGGVKTTITDVNTASIAGEPTGWTTLSGAGLHLTTAYERDALGRATKTTDANGNVIYAVYKDTNHEVRIYPGWNTSTNKPTGPTVVLRDDRANSYYETLTTSATPSLTSSKPNGNESISTGNLQSLSRTAFNSAGQAIRQDGYFSFTSLTYSTSSTLGTLNTHFYRTEFGYDSRGRLNRTLGGDGRIYRTVYDGLGRPISEWLGDDDTPTTGSWSPTNPADMVKTRNYTFDGGQVGDSLLTGLIETVDAAPTTRTTTMDYDFRGRLTKTTLPDPDGGGGQAAPEYETEYDNVGRVIKEIDALEGETTYAINDSARTLTITQPDPDNDPFTSNSPVVVQAFNARGLLVTLTDPNSNATSWQYDGAGRTVKETNASYLFRTYGYNGLGQLTQLIDRNGRKTTYDYDKANRPTDEKWYEGTTLVRTISSTYNDAGWLAQISDPSGAYKYEYDRLGRLKTEKQDLAGLMTDNDSTPDVQYVSDYNGASRLTDLLTTIDGTADFKNTYGYDALARVESIAQQGVSGGNTLAEKRIDFTYNTAGQFDKISRFANVAGTELVANTFHHYDQMGRLDKLVHTMDSVYPSSGWGTTTHAGYTFAYDVASRITGINSKTDGASSFTYDYTNQLTGVDHASQDDESYAYDANGNRQSHLVGSSNEITSDGTYGYAYDFEGNRVARTDNSTYQKRLYDYDHRNRLVAVRDLEPGTPPTDDGSGSGWGTSSHFVNPADPGPAWGSRTGNGSYFNGSVTRSFTATINAVPEGQYFRIELSVSSGNVNDLQFWFDDVTAVINTDYAYSGSSQGTTTMVVTVWAIEDTLNEGLETFEFHVRFSGQPQTEAVLEGDIIDDDGAYSTNQWYALASQYPEYAFPMEGDGHTLVLQASTALTFEYYVEDDSAAYGVDYAGFAGSDPRTWTSVTVTPNVQKFVYFATFLDGETEMTESFKIHVRVAGQSGSEFELEADIFDSGYVESSRVEYAYDAYNQLIHRSYDDDGAFAANDPTETFFSQKNGQIQLQFDGDAASDLAHRYLWGPRVDQLLADEAVTSLTSAGDVLWPLADHLGTIRDIASHNSTTHVTTVENHREYDAFGNLTGESNAAVDLLFGYTGRLWDEQAEIQNNLNRWYDPNVGAWLSQDPIGYLGEQSNLYAYVGNDPVQYSDPLGLQKRPPTAPPLPPKPKSGNFPNTQCVPGATRGDRNDLPDYLPGRWKVSLNVKRPSKLGEYGHAWISFERIGDDGNLTGEVHTVGKWPGGGAQWDTSADLDWTKSGQYTLQSVILDNPVLRESPTFGDFRNNCSSYASEEWNRLAGENYQMFPWDSPNALYLHWYHYYVTPYDWTGQ